MVCATRFVWCSFAFLAMAVTDAATGDDDDIRNSTITSGDIFESLTNIHNVFTKQMQELSNDVKNLALRVPGKSNISVGYNNLGLSNLINRKDEMMKKLNEIEHEVDNVSDPIVFRKVQELKTLLDPMIGNPSATQCGSSNHYGLYLHIDVCLILLLI